MKAFLVCLLIYARVCMHGAESQADGRKYAWCSADNSVGQTCSRSSSL